jgi:hypothetical protein
MPRTVPPWLYGGMADVCVHVHDVRPVAPSGPGCVECTAIGATWVHLRRCTTCGHVGCCDSSPNKHATKHFLAIGHPVVQSYEPGEDWYWCYADEVAFEIPDLPSPSHQ